MIFVQFALAFCNNVYDTHDDNSGESPSTMHKNKCFRNARKQNAQNSTHTRSTMVRMMINND